MEAVFLILVSLTITSAVLSVIFYLAWQTLGRQEHALTWSVTFAVASIQWCVNLLRNLFPSWEIFWIVANALALTTLTLAFYGHCQRLQLPVSFGRLCVPAAGCLTLIAWFTMVQPHTGLQTGLQPAYGAILIGGAAYLMLRMRKTPSPAEWGAALSMTVFALLQLVAAGVTFMQGAEPQPAYGALYSRINFVAMPGAYIAMGMFIVFVLASDLAERLRHIAVRDELTGLLNRRGFTEAAEHAFAAARRIGRPLSIIMTDIDKFKSINDSYGHHAGDRALMHFSRILTESRRDEDILARVGGEEFALVLPGTNVPDSMKIADELCRRLEASPMSVDGGELRMTASFGVAMISARDVDIGDVMIRADSALYRSKRGGRNRIDLESSQMLLTTDGVLKPVS